MHGRLDRAPTMIKWKRMCKRTCTAQLLLANYYCNTINSGGSTFKKPENWIFCLPCKLDQQENVHQLFLVHDSYRRAMDSAITLHDDLAILSRVSFALPLPPLTHFPCWAHCLCLTSLTGHCSLFQELNIPSSSSFSHQGLFQVPTLSLACSVNISTSSFSLINFFWLYPLCTVRR